MKGGWDVIEFKCKQCGADMEAPQSLAGQPEKCPNCGLLNRVPKARPAMQAPPPDHPTGLNQAAAVTRDAAPGRFPVSPPPKPRHYGKPLWIALAIVGGIGAAGVGGYLAMRQGSPKEATHKAAQEPGPAQNESELARLRAENAQLKAEIARAEAAHPPLPVRAAPEPPKPPLPAPTTASPPAPKGITVSGAAYVLRGSGRSDILRGLHVTLIPNTVPAHVLKDALSSVVDSYRNKAARARKEAADKREKAAKFYDDRAKTAEVNAQKYSQILARVSGPMDSAEALKLV